MHLNFGAACAAVTLGIVSICKAQSSRYQDAETGFTFSNYNVPFALGKSVNVRIAVPSPVSPNTSYNTVLQVVIPIELGWYGIAWGGRMTTNPLVVAWASGSTSVSVSSRIASSHSLPSPNPAAQLEILRTGTKQNRTHYQYTAVCTGCTYYTANNRLTVINPAGSNRFAFAHSNVKPSNPASNTSAFAAHDNYNYWTHDLSLGANPTFDALVARNR